MNLVVKGKFTFNDIFWYRFTLSLQQIISMTLLGTGLVAYFLFFATTTTRPLEESILSLVLFAIASPLVMVLTILLLSWITFKRGVFNKGEIVFEFSTKGLRQIIGEKAGEAPWDLFYKLTRAKRGYYFRTGPKQAVLVPLHLFSPEQLAELEELIATSAPHLVKKEKTK